MFPDHEIAENRHIGRNRARRFPCIRGASLSVLVLALGCFWPPYPHAQEETPEEKGLRIAQESNARD